MWGSCNTIKCKEWSLYKRFFPQKKFALGLNVPGLNVPLWHRIVWWMRQLVGGVRVCIVFLRGFCNRTIVIANRGQTTLDTTLHSSYRINLVQVQRGSRQSGLRLHKFLSWCESTRTRHDYYNGTNVWETQFEEFVRQGFNFWRGLVPIVSDTKIVKLDRKFDSRTTIWSCKSRKCDVTRAQHCCESASGWCEPIHFLLCVLRQSSLAHVSSYWLRDTRVPSYLHLDTIGLAIGLFASARLFHLFFDDLQ